MSNNGHDEFKKQAAELMRSHYDYLWIAPETRSRLIEDITTALKKAAEPKPYDQLTPYERFCQYNARILPLEFERLRTWQKEHEHKLPRCGVGVTYTLHPTGIGMGFSVKCNDCDAPEADLTDYDSW